jgi:ATPase subunit of ABC transporter with duplicated ATPase domains
MRPDARIAITGVNGAGKSTLVRAILARVDLPAERVLAMPQEIEAERAAALLAEARALPPERLGQVLNVVSRLGSRPQRLLESSMPSPGEARKLMLALGIQRAPHLIVLDEPTNHLDLPSIEALEAALADCPCGLLLVSHDLRFLDRLTESRWRVEWDGRGEAIVVVEDQ